LTAGRGGLRSWNALLWLYYHLLKWREETVHALAVMHDWEQQKELEETIRELVRLAVKRAELEGYQQGYEDGKRRAVN